MSDERELISPPRDWPACFSKPKLKQFVSGLGGQRVRLTEQPSLEQRGLLHKLGLGRDDSERNAERVRDVLGWEVLGGYALYERASPTGGGSPYVGEARWLNSDPLGVWVDVTPRHEKELVLIESAQVGVTPPSAAQLERLETLRAEASSAEAERRASKAREKEARKARKAEERARKAAEEKQFKEQCEEADRHQREQLELMDPKVRAEREREAAAEKARAAEERAAQARAYEEARARAAAEAEAARAEKEAAEAAEAAAKAVAEEEARKKREAAATKARAEAKIRDAERAASKAEAAAEAARGRLEAGLHGGAHELGTLLGLVTPWKEAGAKCFGVGDHSGALHAYRRAVAQADREALRWPPIESAVIACRANAALCNLKLGELAEAAAEAEAALALPGSASAGHVMLSKLWLRKLSALVGLWSGSAGGSARADAHARAAAAAAAVRALGLLAPKAPASKSLREQVELLEAGPEYTPEAGATQADAESQPLAEVVEVLLSAFHPDRRSGSLPDLLAGLEDLIELEAISPSSAVATLEPSGHGLLWALGRGFSSSAQACHSLPWVHFFIDALAMLLRAGVGVDTRLGESGGHQGSAHEGTSTWPGAAGGCTLLMLAAATGCAAAVRPILDANADAQLRDRNGSTALIHACSKVVESARGLPAASGSGAEAGGARLGDAPIPKRAELIAQRVTVVEALLGASAAVDATDLAGQTALHHAASHDALPLVTALLRAGADPTRRNLKGADVVGVLSLGLGAGAERLRATASEAELCVAECSAGASDEAKAHFAAERAAADWMELLTDLGKISDKCAKAKGARMAEAEAALVGAMLRRFGLDADVLSRPAGERPASNFFYELHSRLVSSAPPPLRRVYLECDPTPDEMALITMLSPDAHRAADPKAAAAAKSAGVRVAAYDADTLKETALVPYRYRGRVAKAMRDYQNLVSLPLQRCIAHAVPTPRALKALAKLGPIVEMGAGSGYWAAMLQSRGVDVVAYDLEPPTSAEGARGFAYRTFCDVGVGDGTALFGGGGDDAAAAGAGLARRALLLVWPGGFDESSDEQTATGWETGCLHAYHAAGGEVVAYVGEREEKVATPIGRPVDAGVTACRSFQQLLRARYDLAEAIELPSTLYTVDELTVWRRKKSSSTGPAVPVIDTVCIN